MLFVLSLFIILSTCQKNLCSQEFVHQFEISENDIEALSKIKHDRLQTRFRRDADTVCSDQEQNFLQEVYQKHPRLEETKVFGNDSNMGMALAWAGTHGTMIVVTSQETFGIPTGASNVYRTEDYGRSFKNITGQLSKDQPVYIRKHAGIFRHPADPSRVYLVSVKATGTTLYITEDSGKTFTSKHLDFQIDGEIQFHPTNKDYLLASSSILSVKAVWVSEDNGKNWKRIADSVSTFKWGSNSKVDNSQTIYATIDPSNTHPFFASFLHSNKRVPVFDQRILSKVTNDL